MSKAINKRHWSSTEDRNLLVAKGAGDSIDSIAQRLGRTFRACECRLSFLKARRSKRDMHISQMKEKAEEVNFILVDDSRQVIAEANKLEELNIKLQIVGDCKAYRRMSIKKVAITT